MSAAPGLALTLPPSAPDAEHELYDRLCAQLSLLDIGAELHVDRDELLARVSTAPLHATPYFAAAANAVLDLVAQGWEMRGNGSDRGFFAPDSETDRKAEKTRIQQQELLRRDQQLTQPSVRRFVARMEQPRSYRGEIVSVFDLMRDGQQLADAIDRERRGSDRAIDPYVQIVDSSSCPLTGLPLQDIWRYFRHTWSNAYSTVPGRSMGLLIRDRATPHHAVIGLAALSSPVVQIAERDEWIGWDSGSVMTLLADHPTSDLVAWIRRRMATDADGIYTADLMRDAVITPDDLRTPSPEAIGRLRLDAERHRLRHHSSAQVHKLAAIPADDWETKAKTDLFRGKRSAALADILDARVNLEPFLHDNAPVEGLSAAATDRQAARHLRRLVRRARGERVGTVIADLTVCGAIAPYNALAAGKLVAALAVSPAVLGAFRTKYARPSQIASSMAGRPVIRESRLAYVGTTSLYSTGSSQYNRLFWPAEVMGGQPGSRMGYHPIGRSRSFGTSHFSDATINAFVRLSAVDGTGPRVNGVFGEGVSPRLRKVRHGLGVLGWPANELMKHGRQRLVYGVPLVSNLLDFSLGITDEPEWLLDPNQEGSDAAVAAWWFERWCRQRALRDDVVDGMLRHSVRRPIHHGARVTLPEIEQV